MQKLQKKELTARLVVLSCCATGRGNVSAEGVIGIVRAFLSAGARSLLASLGTISDDSTKKFMTNFYHHLVEGKSASEALHLAMRDLREDPQKKYHPAKCWVPFCSDW